MREKSLIVATFLALCFGIAGSRADDSQPSPAPAAKAALITRVTLHLQGAVAQDAFDELAKQGGIKFSIPGGWDQDALQTENDVDITDRPFWEAVNQVCDLWKLSLQSNRGTFSNSNQIQLAYTGGMDRVTTKLPTFESDGFLVQASSFSHLQSIDYMVTGPAQNSCSVQLQVFVDPAIHIASFDPNPKVLAAMDDAGNSMMPDGRSPVFGGRSQRSLVHSCWVPLKYPSNPGKTIADLKFEIAFDVCDESASMTIDKPLEAAETSKDLGDTSITFHSLKKTGNNVYELKIGIAGSERKASSEHKAGNRPWDLLQSAQLLDSNGSAYRYGGGTVPMGTPGEMVECTLIYRAFAMRGTPAAGDPVKWVLELATKTHPFKLPVEFKDLLLP